MLPGEGTTVRWSSAQWPLSARRIFAHSFLPAASPKALTRISREIRNWALHHRSDKSLSDLAAMYNPCIRGWINYYSPLLSDAVASNPEKDRCLRHSMGSPQIQADGPLDQGREGLVRSAAPRESNTLCPLATMPRQRPNIGSRMNREVHVRFWERCALQAR